MSKQAIFNPPAPLKTAVLFLVFNRLDTTKQVFEAIRQAKPPRLYIAADGPRTHREGEDAKVKAVRNYVMQEVNWNCEVHTLFRENNLGCKHAVSSAITWFFEQEEQGIIIEDDCLPSLSFFWFCEELLNKYKDDMRVWHISGDNFQEGIQRGNGDYYFSRYNHIWGWASWANRWAHYDVKLSNFELFLSSNEIHHLLDNPQSQANWSRNFRSVHEGEIDTWDYQWTYTVWSQSGLSILPNKNLISNIGFGPDATHTTSLDSQHSKIPRENIPLPLKHPDFLIRNTMADQFTEQRVFPAPRNLLIRIAKRLLNSRHRKNEM